MKNNRVLTGIAALVAAAGLIGTSAALSGAATNSPTSSSTSTSATAAPDGSSNPNNDTAVNGSALAKVTAAVKAEDSAVTVTSVRMDPDGSYDVFGTKAGTNVRYDVSKDLATITTGGGGGHHGGGGGGNNDTPVTGAALAKVTAAMKAKDSAVAVTSVRMDPDGSYDVFGTKAGANVRYDVSKDLATFTAGGGGQQG